MNNLLSYLTQKAFEVVPYRIEEFMRDTHYQLRLNEVQHKENLAFTGVSGPIGRNPGQDPHYRTIPTISGKQSTKLPENKNTNPQKKGLEVNMMRARNSLKHPSLF